MVEALHADVARLKSRPVRVGNRQHAGPCYQADPSDRGRTGRTRHACRVGREPPGPLRRDRRLAQAVLVASRFRRRGTGRAARGVARRLRRGRTGRSDRRESGGTTRPSDVANAYDGRSASVPAVRPFHTSRMNLLLVISTGQRSRLLSENSHRPMEVNNIHLDPDLGKKSEHWCRSSRSKNALSPCLSLQQYAGAA